MRTDNDKPYKSRGSSRPDDYREAREVSGGHIHADDADHLFIAAEEDFDAAIPMILAELRLNRSTNRRESCVFLLDCYANLRFAVHVLRALKRENSLSDKADKADKYIYVNALLTFGEPMLEPMLTIWTGPESDAYSRDVAGEFLTRFLSKPLV
ncbi:MAG: hypothetical protein ACI856_002263 [Kiritimatiellia bacterium]|jgi:hypothetical protein